MARGLAAIVACPITVVKTQMEHTGPGAVQYRSTAHCLGSIVQQRGVRGLFRGVGPTLLSNAPFSAVYYVFYTQLQVGLGWQALASAQELRRGCQHGALQLRCAFLKCIVLPAGDCLDDTPNVVGQVGQCHSYCFLSRLMYTAQWCRLLLPRPPHS
mgnify:CR=1 FL=1